MAPSDSEPATNLQSLRSSCDRCRFHKLKCNVPPESGGAVPCERCTRAKVPCVFGRRRRANRPSDEKKRSVRTTQPPSPPNSISASIPTPSSALAPIPSLGFDPSINFRSDPHTADLAESARDATTSIHWENLMIGSTDGSDSSGQGQPSNRNSWEWLHNGTGIDEGCVFDVESLELASWSPPILPMMTMVNEASVIPQDTTKTSNWALVQRLLALIADMQQCLKMLEQGPWHGDCTQNLNDYPVGTIIHLSQEYGAMAGSVLFRATATGMARSPDHRQQNNRDEPKGPSIGVDTETALLVLGGYKWLVRIYNVVLSHFQAHLSHPSCAGDGGSRGAAMMDPSLQLGELPSANMAPELGRIYTALRMLLGALQEVEEQIGRGGAVARNLVVALLTQEAVSLTDELQDCGGLGGKVESVKELLRERMGF